MRDPAIAFVGKLQRAASWQAAAAPGRQAGMQVQDLCKHHAVLQ
jgi:hypothetical protein